MKISVPLTYKKMPTTLELKRKEWTPYIKAASQRVYDTTLTPDEQKERERLLERVLEVAELLKYRFAVRRVILFGSLAHTAWFMPDSDVDLAVTGLAPDFFWTAWRVAEEIIGDQLVDLVEMETVGDGLRKAIERHGIEHGKSNFRLASGMDPIECRTVVNC